MLNNLRLTSSQDDKVKEKVYFFRPACIKNRTINYGFTGKIEIVRITGLEGTQWASEGVDFETPWRAIFFWRGVRAHS
jgi:hypothetical protein